MPAMRLRADEEEVKELLADFMVRGRWPRTSGSGHDTSSKTNMRALGGDNAVSFQARLLPPSSHDSLQRGSDWSRGTAVETLILCKKAIVGIQPTCL